MVWFDNLIRWIFGGLDSLAGWAVEILYTLIIQIANVNIFGDFITEFGGRVYSFLTIFMLFKLSISVVNYVLNPEQLTDKTKGFGKIIQNVIIVIALIIMVPRIFTWAYDLQALILNTNVLYTVITGKVNSSDYDIRNTIGIDVTEEQQKEFIKKIKESSKEAADQIKYELMSTFIYYDKNNSGNSEPAKFDGTTCEGTKNSYADKYKCLMEDALYDKKEPNSGLTTKKFTNEYKLLISTLCIGAAAYIFLIFAFDVALRCVRLGALQLIAPIPIISMLDPNSGKNGMFSKWLKDCQKTYLSLFIRLAGLYFAIAIITGMSNNTMVWYGTTEKVEFGFVKVFIILGLLMFAKQLPQFIESITGIKMDAGGLNLKKKLGSVPGLNRATAGAIGLGGGIAANSIAAFKNKEGLKGIGSTLAGGFSGARRGLVSKEKNAFKAGQGAIKGAVDARNLRDQRQATGYTFRKRISAGVDTFAGLNPMQKYENQLKAYEDLEKQAGAILSRANGEMIKHESLQFKDNAGNNITMKDFKVAKEYLNALRNTDTSNMSQSQLLAHTNEINRLQNNVAKTEKLAEQAYVDAVNNGAIRDVQTNNMISGMNQTFDTYVKQGVDLVESSARPGNKVERASTGAGVKDIKDSYADAKSGVVNSDGYKQAMANKKAK